ncbi:MAG: ATP-binding protein [Lentisphaeraceae bacterium]|nr:ATP-binding protein [Lentisphaeraceae bacterium]
MKYLIVDDNKYDFKLLKLKLDAIDEFSKVDLCDNIDSAVDFVKNSSPDMVFLDYELRNDNAFSFFEKINMMSLDTPRTVILTGVDRGENLESLLSLGAIDYLIKDDLNEDNLKILISRSMANFRKIKDFNFFKSIVDSSPEIKLIQDRKERILYVNEAAKNLWKDEILIGMKLDSVLFKQPEGYYKIKASDQTFKILPSKSWDENLSTLTLINVHDEVSNNHDLEIKASKAVNFSRMLVHDLKDNLGASIQLTELISMEADDEEKNDIKFLEKSLKNCMDIIDSLAEISGVRNTTYDNKIELTELISEVIATIDQVEKVDIRCEHDVRGNRNLLKTIFQNLIINSVKHRYKGKGLELEIYTELSGSEVIVHFKDNGPGIPPEMKDKIFDDKVKGNSSEGMGLGLFIVNQALDILNGSISVDNSSIGAYFRLKFQHFN